MSTTADLHDAPLEAVDIPDLSTGERVVLTFYRDRDDGGTHVTGIVEQLVGGRLNEARVGSVVFTTDDGRRLRVLPSGSVSELLATREVSRGYCGHLERPVGGGLDG